MWDRIDEMGWDGMGWNHGMTGLRHSRDIRDCGRVRVRVRANMCVCEWDPVG